MKKLILAIIALAFAFAFSSCCDQNFCPNRMRCGEDQKKMNRNSSGDNERPYRWDRQNAERPRRW